MLRRPLLLGLVIGFACVFSLSGQVYAQSALPVGKVNQVWPHLDASQRNMVDLLAADFFQNELSSAQRERIFATRAEEYRSAHGQERDFMRAQRRQEWQAKSSKNAQTGTSFDLLSEQQKAPFRRYAIDQLGLGEVAVPVTPATRDQI